MAYKLVRIGQETFPGSDVEAALAPDAGYPFWYIKLKSGVVIRTSHPVTVIEDKGKEAQA